jgi:hypothetical protein
VKRVGFDGCLLVVLILVLASVSVYYGARGGDRLADTNPTTHGTAPAGLRAYYELLRVEGIAARRWDHNLTILPPSAGLLVIGEPLEVPVEKEERDAVRKWVRGGGTLLLVATTSTERAKAGLALPALNLAGGTDKRRDVKPDVDASFTRGVASVSVRGKDRIYRDEDDAAGDPQWESVLYQGDDVYMATATLGRGRLIVATPGAGLLNGDIGRADNAVLYYNIARGATANRPDVLFDEYHQGFGYVEATGRTLWQAIGRPARAAFWYMLGVFAVALYSLNRRFGRPLSLPAAEALSTGDYVTSMAGLYRRAAAREVAIGEMQRACVRILTVRLGLPPDAGVVRLAADAARLLGLPAEQTRVDLQRAAAIAEGAKVTEAEAVALARRLATYRRRAELDGTAG